MRKNGLIFFFSLFSVILFSQNTVRGKITNQDGVPLSGSHIQIGTKSVSSNDMGIYLIKRLPSGVTKVHVSYIGFKSIDTVLTIQGDVVLDFVLQPQMDELKEVVIKEKANTVNTSVLEQKIKGETIEKFSNQTLGELLKNIPGVSTLKTGSTVVKPIIHGLFGSRVPVINNSVRLEDQQWGTEHAPNFDVNAAGKITVIKGASGLQYGGDAVGGLVIISPVAVTKDTLYGKTILNYASNGRGGSISSSLHKGIDKGWSWNALTTYKYMGDREAPNYVLSNTGNREFNFFGDLKYSGAKYDLTTNYSFYSTTIGILRASHTGNVNDLYNSISNKVPSVIADFTYDIGNPKQEVQHHLASAHLNYYFDETASLSLQYAFQFNKRKEFDLRRGDFRNRPALDLELATHSFTADYKKVVHDWVVKSGGSASFQNNFANPATGVQPLIPSYNRIEVGAYGIASYDFSETLTADAGLRYDFYQLNATKFYSKSRWNERGFSNRFDHFIVGEQGNQWFTKPEFKFHNVSASLGFRKTFEANTNWYFNLSLANRNPNPSEFFSDGLHHSSGVIELGDLGLQKEQSIKVTTTFQKKWSQFSFEISPFVNQVDNFMFLRPIAFETTIRGAFPVWEYQQTNARLAGFDFQSHWQINSTWQYDFSLAYVRGKDVTNRTSLIDIPPLNLGNSIQFSKKEWYHFKAELKSEMVFRQNHFPDTNFVANVIENNSLVPVLVDISSPPPAFHLLHLYSEMKFKTTTNSAITIALFVQNMLNTSYRDYLNRQRFFADEMGRNIQLQLKFNY
jgi:iron complex outermembrane receptor protein